MFCGRCGKRIDAGSTYCPYCGARVESDVGKAPVCRAGKHGKPSHGWRWQLLMMISTAGVLIVRGILGSCPRNETDESDVAYYQLFSNKNLVYNSGELFMDLQLLLSVAK